MTNSSESSRVFNFGAGPAVIPEPVLEEARHDLLALPGIGMSVLEISHRSSTFTEIIQAAEANIRQLVGLPDDYHVLFLQGGATQQFAMVPMNLLPNGGTAEYVVTGSWAKKAAKEAERFGTVRIVASTADEEFSRIPEPSELKLSDDAAYVHITSNNTICGTQWRQMPDTGDRPLVVDASSDILSRPIDLGPDSVGLLYAGAQKNLGPAGVTLVLVRDDLVQRLESVDRTVPTMLRYSTYASSGSLHNTPPVFAIYIVGLVTKWLLANGGLEAMATRNERKAQKVYAAIDRTEFYRGTAQLESRSLMNVTIRLPNEELEGCFVKKASAAGLVGLKGHRSVGGLRASIYNAFPEAGVDAFVDFMDEFARVNG
jgi:phosphoserine aminotransferase